MRDDTKVCSFRFFFIRYLLSKGFARLNKWFVLPVNGHSDVKVYVNIHRYRKRKDSSFVRFLDRISPSISIFFYMVITKSVLVLMFNVINISSI